MLYVADCPFKKVLSDVFITPLTNFTMKSTFKIVSNNNVINLRSRSQKAPIGLDRYLNKYLSTDGS